MLLSRKFRPLFCDSLLAFSGEGKEKKGKEVRKREERKWDTGSTLLVGGVTTGSSLSAIWSATLWYVGSLYHHIEISVRAHRERQLPSGCLLQLAICIRGEMRKRRDICT